MAQDVEAVADARERRLDNLWLGAIVLLKLALNGAAITRYGFQRDELYFIACGRHLDWGYVDHSPFVPWMARLSQALFGESLLALRLFPLLAGGLTVLLTGLLARRFGAKRFGQCLAAFCAVIAPAYLRATSILHIPTFEPVFWLLAVHVLLSIVRTDNVKLWPLFGLVAGCGLMNKPTMLFFGVAVAAALVLTPARKHFLSPWLYAGGLVALLVYLPNLVWQYQNGWPTYHFVRGLNKEVMSRIGLPDFLLGQLLYMHPVNAVVWIWGLGFLLFSKAGRPLRIFGWTFVGVLVILITAKSKVYYLAPAYPMLLAAGALAIEQAIARRGAAWAKPAAFTALALGGAWFLPVALPLLPVESAPGYVSFSTGGLVDPNMAHEITGDWRDQFGWEEQARAVAGVYEELSAEEKADCVILARNYGQASAINFYGPRLGLPYAVSPHMSYLLWGTGERTGRTLIAYGLPKEELERYCTSVKQRGLIASRHVNQWETNMPIYVCKPRETLQSAWRTLPRRYL